MQRVIQTAIIIIDESLFILNSTVVLSQSFVATTKGTNCSRTEQILCHSPTVPMSDADFVQIRTKRGAFPGPGSEPREPRITQIWHNSFWVKYNHANSTRFTPLFILSSGQGVYRARAQITQISRNSFRVQYNHANSTQFAPFFLLSSNPVKIQNQESRFARFMYKHKNLELCKNGG